MRRGARWCRRQRHHRNHLLRGEERLRLCHSCFFIRQRDLCHSQVPPLALPPKADQHEDLYCHRGQRHHPGILLGCRECHYSSCCHGGPRSTRRSSKRRLAGPWPWPQYGSKPRVHWPGGCSAGVCSWATESPTVVGCDLPYSWVECLSFICPFESLPRVDARPRYPGLKTRGKQAPSPGCGCGNIHGDIRRRESEKNSSSCAFTRARRCPGRWPLRVLGRPRTSAPRLLGH